MATYVGWSIDIEHSPASFGQAQGFDIVASIERYDIELEHDLREIFPEASIEIRTGINDRCRVYAPDPDPELLRQEEEVLAHIDFIQGRLFENAERWAVEDPAWDG